MAWGAPGVSKYQLISNGAINWGPGGFPASAPLQQVGILKELRMIQNGSPTFTVGTGVITQDILGPYNAYNNLSLISNQQAPIFQTSGYGMYLINVIKNGLENLGTPDTTMISVLNHTETSYRFNFPQNALAAAPANQQLNWFLDLPVSQRVKSLGGDVGMFILQNPNIVLTFAFTPNSASAASAYNIYSTTAGNSPYKVTNNATVTLATPSVDLVRKMFEAVTNQADYPNLQWVSQWLEESPQSAVGGATQLNWKKNPVAGLLCRIIGYVFDSTNSNGVYSSNLTAANAINLTYETNITKFSETGIEALDRQHDQLGGFDAPQGCFFYDLLGPDLTVQDVLNTATVPNIQFQMNFAAALGSSSTAKIVYQTLIPVAFQ